MSAADCIVFVRFRLYFIYIVACFLVVILSTKCLDSLAPFLLKNICKDCHSLHITFILGRPSYLHDEKNPDWAPSLQLEVRDAHSQSNLSRCRRAKKRPALRNRRTDEKLVDTLLEAAAVKHCTEQPCISTESEMEARATCDSVSCRSLKSEFQTAICDASSDAASLISTDSTETKVSLVIIGSGQEVLSPVIHDIKNQVKEKFISSVYVKLISFRIASKLNLNPYGRSWDSYRSFNKPCINLQNALRSELNHAVLGLTTILLWKYILIFSPYSYFLKADVNNFLWMCETSDSLVTMGK